MSPHSKSRSADLPRTNFGKGQHYLQLSLKTLDELASLSEHDGLSASQKASYAEACRNSRTLSEETIRIRDQLLTQKKSFRKFLVNLFIRESSTKHFYKVSFRNYSSIRRTSDDLNRLFFSEIDGILTSINLGKPAQGNEAVDEDSRCNVVEDNPGLSLNENTQGINLEVHSKKVQETRVANSREDDEGDVSTRSPCDVVEGSHSAEGPPLNENTQDINLNVCTEQGVQDALAIFDGLGIKFSREEREDDNDCDDDGSETIRPSPPQSRASSPYPTCTVNIFINQSVVSFDSESTGTTLNVGINKGVDLAYN